MDRRLHDIDKLWQGAEQGDLRFQFEIIKGLGESVRALANEVKELNDKHHETNERLIRIEANKVGEQIAALQAKVERLEHDNLRQQGAAGVWSAIRQSNFLGYFISFLLGAAALAAVLFKDKV